MAVGRSPELGGAHLWCCSGDLILIHAISPKTAPLFGGSIKKSFLNFCQFVNVRIWGTYASTNPESRSSIPLIYNGHLPVFTHAKNDLASFRLFTSQLIVQGSATQGHILKAFGVPLKAKRSLNFPASLRGRRKMLGSGAWLKHRFMF